MDNLVEITLVNQSSSTDSIGQETITETTATIMGYIRSVNQSEWFSAGANDINAEYVVTVYDFEYNGQTIAEIDGVRYGVYRTYRLANSDQIELYLEKKGGVTYGKNDYRS